MQAVRAFRALAVAEAISWLLLIAATVIKYAADQAIGVHVMGPIHGVLFIGYVLLALNIRSQLGWSAKTLLIVLVDAVLPGGAFVVARRNDLQPVAVN